MRNHRIVVLVVLIVGAALVVGYLIGRSPALHAPPATASVNAAGNSSGGAIHPRKSAASTTSTKAKPDAPAGTTTLKDLIPDLTRRADANDASAASELYTDLGRCARQKELSRALPSWTRSELESDTSGDSEEQLKAHALMLDSMQKQIDFVQRNAAFCDGMDDHALEQFVPAALKAAQLGDLKAVRCYLGGAISSRTYGLLDHPEWLTDFKQNALALSDYGFEHGDWGVVALREFAYQGYFSSSLFGQLIGSTDPAQAYRNLKLQQIAASGDFLKKISQQTDSAAEDLTPDQIAEADAWAQDMYARYFNGSSSNELSNGVNTCGAFGD